MQTGSRFIAMLLCASLSCAGTVTASPQAHEHHAPPPTAATPTPTPAKRWATDAPLRQGMADIRNGVEAVEHYEHGHMGPEQVTALANTIEGYIGQIVLNCKLEPQADMALHEIIGKLLHGTAMLKKGVRDEAAIAAMRQALVDYQRQFDDPDWNKPAATKH